MATKISVRGEAKYQESPERATVHLTLSLQGFTREYVHDDISRSLEQIDQGIRGLRQGDDAPVTWHAIQGVRSWSWKDKNDTVMYTEAVDIQVKFRNFKRMSDWIADVSITTGVSVDYIGWALTESRKLEKQKELRFKAVQNAREKADQYAESIGTRIISITQVSDSGMLEGGSSASYGGDHNFRGSRSLDMAGAAPGGSGINFEPEDIELSSSVDIQCLAE